VPQQVVDLALASEEEVFFVRLERPQPRKGIKQKALPSAG
jgi:hypothetical protein